MAKSTGKVSKHRLMTDISPYTESINSLNELTKSFGFENPNSGNQSYQFEHYVAWALYKAGHSIWGPTIDELTESHRDMKWLGEDPYI